MSLTLKKDDEPDSRQVPEIECCNSGVNALAPRDCQLVCSATVRAGARHPGVLDRDLQVVHREAYREHHLELFTDLNAITTGLLGHLVRSLGHRVGRVTISSSSIDILHEYRSHQTKGTDRSRSDMVRALLLLDEIRARVPVHVHQLPPGATRYFVRSAAQPKPESPDENEATYISEDRQMIAAFWDYAKTSNPRVPIRFVTSDFNLAHVCHAERLPFFFARAPFEHWRHERHPVKFAPETLWFDPFAMQLRAVPMASILFELVLAYGVIDVRSSTRSQAFGLRYDGRSHVPGEPPQIDKIDVDSAAAVSARSGTGLAKARSDGGGHSTGDRGIKLAITHVLAVLPMKPGTKVPMSLFPRRDEDALRQLRQIGDLTGLYSMQDDFVVDGPALPDLLHALHAGDYETVNRLFARHPTYARTLVDAQAGAPFPGSKTGYQVAGWAVTLGAAYKRATGEALYGLCPVDDPTFTSAVTRAHQDAGQGQLAVPLPEIMDRVCMDLKTTPIRFEAQLNRTLGLGALSAYEAQRATVQGGMPSHKVIAVPEGSPPSYVRNFDPAHGLVVGGKLAGSLVRRQEN